MTIVFDGTYGITTPNVNESIQPITASVASNALTVTLNITALSFRSATLTSGTINVRSVTSPISVTVSSGSTLGTVSAQQSRLVVIAIDNAGTVELAIVNIAGGNQLDETTLISTTAEGGAGAADSANVIYSTTARTSVPFRVVGYIESTQATAGTWATAPSTIQGVGGQALTAMSSLGYSQSWQNVTASRAFGTTYYNTTGRPIYISVVGNAGSQINYTLTVNGQAVQIMKHLASDAIMETLFGIIPPNASYIGTVSAGTPLNITWCELR